MEKEFMDRRLLKAARSGDIREVKELIAKDDKSKIDHQMTPEGNTVLHIAARFGPVGLVKIIVEKHASLVLKSNLKGETPMHIAAKAGQLDIVEYFIESAKKFSRIYVARIRDKYGNTPLHGAVRNGHYWVIQALAKYDNESLLLINDAGESPLSIAIDMRSTATAKSIISLNDSTLKFIGHNGQTALHYAVLRKDFDTMTAILEKEKNKENENKNENKKDVIVQHGKRKPADKVQDEEKRIPLVKVQDEKRRTPLHYAAALGHQKMVDKLLEADPSVAYIRDSNQQIPIHLAAKKGQKSLIRKLLDECPDTIEMVDKKQRNLLHLAAKTGNLDVVKHILSLDEMEDLVNSPDTDGNTPLHLATRNYYSDVVDVLSESPKVEIRAINNFNQTALEIVKLPDGRGMDLQKHLTLKALKNAYKKKAISPEESLEDTELDDVEVEKGSRDGKAEVENGSKDGSKKSREMAQTISVMSTLIATFTFTAAFTIPGGFKSDGKDAGMAMLISKSAFQAFVITDTVAMTSSITSAVIVFWSMSRRDTESFMDTLPVAIGLTWISLIAMALAFVTGLFVVLQKTLWLAILVCVFGCASPFVLYVFAPMLLLLWDRFFESQTSYTRRRNLVDENPLFFIFRLLRMFVESQARNLCNCLRSCCSRSCCSCCTHTSCSKWHCQGTR